MSEGSQVYARVIADSIIDGVSGVRPRLTTVEVRFHRFVVAEFNTHRVFSRNSASSRAIPVSKQIERVRESPAVPVSWPAEQPGMQGGEELLSTEAYRAEREWLRSSNQAADSAEALRSSGLHKSVVNRVLEPYLMHTAVVTATAWENWVAQRCSPLAQPEIRVAAEAIREAMAASIPRPLVLGQWHLPYLSEFEVAALGLVDAIKVSAARCARVSYLTQSGVRDTFQDLELYDRLVSATPMHASPLEHVATPAPTNMHYTSVNQHHRPESDRVWPPPLLLLPRYGNLLGWHQHRFDVESTRGYQSYA